MALTPEDVVNKRFQPTKFREGYDQDEVDDFLDEVVVELRRLNQENEELKQRLAASDSRIAELQRGGGSHDTSPERAGHDEYAHDEHTEHAPAEQQGDEHQTAEQAAPVAAPAAAAATATYSAPAGDPNDPSSTNSLLQLARRLHEEHVREGIEKRDSLIAEGHATAARIVAEAESKQREQIAVLEQERSQLEGRIEGLRTFERDYRQQLRGYIEGQLRDLDASAANAPSGQGGQSQSEGSTDSHQQSSFQSFGA